MLEAAFLVTLLRPHHRNFGKRLIKNPKLYFLDPGLLCYLLDIRSAAELLHRAERGAVFESFVVSEFCKNYLHRGETPRLHFWRDSGAHEVDLVADRGAEWVPVEIKSAQTVAPGFFDNLAWWRKLAGQENGPAALIYGGDDMYRRGGVCVYPWRVL